MHQAVDSSPEETVPGCEVHPLASTIGVFKDDPYWDDFMEAMAENRRIEEEEYRADVFNLIEEREKEMQQQTQHQQRQGRGQRRDRWSVLVASGGIGKPAQL